MAQSRRLEGGRRAGRPRPPSSRLSWVTAGLVVVGLAMVVAGLVLPSDALPDGSTAAESASDGPQVVPLAPGDDITAPPGAPALIVPSIGLDAPLVPIEVDPQGVLTPPSDTDIVGWWQRSAQPGDSRGQIVLTGHTVHTGGGVMNRLGSLDLDSRVLISSEGDVDDYRVTGVLNYPKAELAERADSLFGQKRPGNRLVLVTCTDWVDGEYLSNIVVFAEPLGDGATA